MLVEEMTEAEFNEIRDEYLKQEKRWNKIKIGDIIFTVDVSDYFGTSYFAYRVISINVPVRRVTAKLVEYNFKTHKIIETEDPTEELRYFYTLKEV